MDRLNQCKNIFSCLVAILVLQLLIQKNLTPANIIIGIDGNKWIFIHRKKPIHLLMLQFNALFF